jgi:pyroglutamyl-peptidase
MNRAPLLLVTGFGPFPGIPRNPSERAARDVARALRWRRLGVDARAVALSTTYEALESELAPALAEHGPDAVLMIGVSGRSREIRIEVRGVNRASTLLPDAARKRPSGFLLSPGPAGRATRAKPIRQVATVRRHGFRVRASIDAGRYLCNASYFTALEQDVPVLFVHIPKPGRAVRRRPGAKVRASWHDRLALALGDVAADLLRQARS